MSEPMSEPMSEEPIVNVGGAPITYSEYVNKHVDWTPERISEMKVELSTAPQIANCIFEEPPKIYTAYPNVKEFEACSS
jgi:hypothetical protein